MSMLLQAHGIAYSIGGNPLFRDLTLAIEVGDRVGLVGHNGCGKSTLFALLTKQLEPDAGEVAHRQGLQLAQVEQFLPTTLRDLSLLDAAINIGNGTTEKAVEPWQAEALLAQLGFSDQQLAVAVDDLSGGQQNRLMFARAVLSEPELLLLDEPTNHLDMATLQQFEVAIGNFRGGILLISHDRAFLDNVTTRTLYLRDNKIYSFSGAYSVAEAQLEEMDLANARLAAVQDKKIDSVKRSAARLKSWASAHESEKLARRAKSMEKRAERMEKDRVFVSRGSPLELNLTLGDNKSKQTLSVAEYSVTVADHFLFQIDALLLRPGERVALLGDNGVGKSTFIDQLVDAFQATKQDPPIIHSQMGFSPQVTLGYYDQELHQVAGNKSMIDFVANRTIATDQQIRQHLIGAGFAYGDHGKTVANLSGGERARLLFVVLAIQAPNLLILDEPTNHIDITGKRQLEQQLLGSDATLIITSHDRRFLETVADRFLWIKDGKLQELNDLAEFFNYSLTTHTQTDVPTAPVTQKQQTDPAHSQENLLERIIELEDLIEADRQRKPKFQKPKLQKEWQTELQVLTKKLENQ